MAFDDPEENQDQTMMLPALRRFGYPLAGDDQRFAGMSIAGMPLPAGMRPEPAAPQMPNIGRESQSVPKLGIGHRILGLGSELQPRAAGQAQAGARESIGQRIMSMGRQMDPVRRFPQPSHPPMAGVGQGAEPQGIFSSFVPPGADPRERELLKPYSPVSAGLGRLANPNSSFGGGGNSGFGSTSSFGSDGSSLNFGRAGNGASAGGGGGQRQQRKVPAQGRAGQRLKQQNQAGRQQGVQQTGQQAGNPTFLFGASQPDPSWSETREYIAQEARAYGVPVKLAEAVVRHESNFDIHLETPVRDRKGKITGYDRGIMQVNDTNKNWITGPHLWGFKVDPERVKNDWKYNVHVGMAILRNAYVAARLNTAGEENIARETYARYNAPSTWKQLYTVLGGRINRNVDQFMKSWRQYYQSK